MGRKLLSSYRYTPIEPLQTDVAVSNPTAEQVQITSNASAPPKYTAPTDLPDYDQVGGEPVAIFRLTEEERAPEIPLGTTSQFLCHALLVFMFGIFGLFFSCFLDMPSHAKRLGRSFGVGLLIFKMATYMRYSTQIMCWLEHHAIPDHSTDVDANGTGAGDAVIESHTITRNGHSLEVVTINGKDVVDFCSKQDDNPDMNVFFPFLWALGSFIILFTLCQLVVIRRQYRLQKMLVDVSYQTE